MGRYYREFKIMRALSRLGLVTQKKLNWLGCTDSKEITICRWKELVCVVTNLAALEIGDTMLEMGDTMLIPYITDTSKTTSAISSTNDFFLSWERVTENCDILQ